ARAFTKFMSRVTKGAAHMTWRSYDEPLQAFVDPDVADRCGHRTYQHGPRANRGRSATPSAGTTARVSAAAAVRPVVIRSHRQDHARQHLPMVESNLQ